MKKELIQDESVYYVVTSYDRHVILRTTQLRIHTMYYHVAMISPGNHRPSHDLVNITAFFISL